VIFVTFRHLQESHFLPFFCAHVALEITASEIPSVDQEGGRVTGQLLDEESKLFWLDWLLFHLKRI
jgi:hypothetical protein